MTKQSKIVLKICVIGALLSMAILWFCYLYMAHGPESFWINLTIATTFVSIHEVYCYYIRQNLVWRILCKKNNSESIIVETVWFEHAYNAKQAVRKGKRYAESIGSILYAVDRVK